MNGRTTRNQMGNSHISDDPPAEQYLREIVQIGERKGHERIGGRAAARVAVKARGGKGGAAQGGRVTRLELGAKLREKE